MTIKYLIFTLIILGVLAVFGFSLFKSIPAPSDISKNSAQLLVPSDSFYKAAKPKYGNFTQTYTAKAIFENVNDVGMIKISKQDISQIKQGQDVILYDQENNILPLAGNIQLIRPNKDGADILIKLPNDTDTSLLSENIEVITFQNKTMKLLPISAIQKDNEGQNYLWRVNQDGTLTKEPIEISHINHDYFSADKNYDRDVQFIINPNESINENTSTEFETVRLDLPNYGPIYTAWLQYEQDRLAQNQLRMKQEAQDCANGITQNAQTTPDGQTVAAPTSCGASQQILSAEQIFSNIQNMRDGNTQGSSSAPSTPSACGGASTGSCGP